MKAACQQAGDVQMSLLCEHALIIREHQGTCTTKPSIYQTSQATLSSPKEQSSLGQDR